MTEIESKAEDYVIDAALMAEAFALTQGEVRSRMRIGAITSPCEAGVDADAGRWRLTHGLPRHPRMPLHRRRHGHDPDAVSVSDHGAAGRCAQRRSGSPERHAIVTFAYDAGQDAGRSVS